MQKARLSFLFILQLLLVAWEQPQKKENPFALEIVSEMSVYDRLVKANPSHRLIDLESEIKGIKLDIRYATTNNFTGQVIYPSPSAYLRLPAAEALARIQQELKSIGLGLKIYDAYRPYAVTLKFFEVYPDTTFVASPRTGSKHNRGCAVDLTLIDLASGAEKEMPSTFDDFTEKASHSYRNASPSAIANRQLLREIMTKYGFLPYESEWWHYDFKDWKNYPIMDLSFNECANNKLKN
jgi:D-alanyl-D-alanine dipeptidase